MKPTPFTNLVALVAVLATTPTSRAAEEEKTKKVVADPQYAASGPFRWLFGDDYRDLWTTPATFEILDLQAEAGGLTPVRRVGGQQTKGLALKGQDGRSYTFRGLDKDPTKLLQEDLKGTVVERLLQDQMAAQHPASEVIARGLLDAVGVPCPAWRLVVMPDDPALADFRKDFAGAIGVFAEYPSAASGTTPGFRGATQIIDHLELYKRLEAGSEDRADVRALLRARLIDIFMGDWDRHRKQWRWARFPESPLWQPIPEDRDQAFSRYEGLITDSARRRDGRIQKFQPKYPNIGGLTYNGWEQDRRLLTPLTRDDFRETATTLRTQLTDAAIEQAVHAMPPEWYALDGARLAAGLKARRDALPEVADKYFLHLNDRADIYLTNLSEQIDASRGASGDLSVSVRPIGADGRVSEEPSFQRVFHRGETEEVRVYALGGNDKATVSGGPGIRVRMIGGNGDDSLDARGAGDAKLSDASGANHATSAAQDARAYTPPPPPKSAPWIPPRDWGSETWTTPWFSYGSDLGVFIGGGIDTRNFAFRKDPFANRHLLRAGFSFGEKSGRFDYTGLYHRENRKSAWGLHVYLSGVDVLRFYGFGNESPNQGDDEFFKVSANQALVLPVYTVPLANRVTLAVGPAVKYTTTDEDEVRFINEARPYGVGKFGQVGAAATLRVDTRDLELFPRKGVLLGVRGSVFPKLWDVEEAFGQVNAEARGYISAGKVLTLALRAGGKKVFGKYPFHEAASIGSGGFETSGLGYPSDTLRGFRTARFAGDAAAFGNADLRLKLSRITLILPGTWGVVGFGDVGRVWLEGESSDTWHASAGGGLWLSFVNDRFALNSGIEHSKEEDLFYFSGGFSF